MAEVTPLSSSRSGGASAFVGGALMAAGLAQGTDLLEGAYIGRIEQFSGERILYFPERVDAHYATVRSRIVTRRPAEIAVNDRLQLRDGRWRVYDVLLEGVSFVATFRTEFDRIIQQSSYSGLVDKLRKRGVQTTALEKTSGRM
jgi:phospholipid transport system substrate-binding protein